MYVCAPMCLIQAYFWPRCPESRPKNYIRRSHPQSNRDDVHRLECKLHVTSDLNQELGAQGATSHDARQPGSRASGLDPKDDTALIRTVMIGSAFLIPFIFSS